MNIYLLLIDGDRCFFYSAEHEDEAEAAEQDFSATKPAEGWLSRLTARLAGRLEQIKQTWEGADEGLVGKTRGWWNWLHSFIHPQESMLIRLYWAKRIDLYHPASHSAEIRTIWHTYLWGRAWRHMIWLGIDATIAPFTLLLAPFPGPNLIGYWFTYRAIHHGLIVLGIRRARFEKVPTALIASEALDYPVHRDDEGKPAHSFLQDSRHQGRLHVYYEWANGRRGAPPDGPKPGPNDHGDGSTPHESS